MKKSILMFLLLTFAALSSFAAEIKLFNAAKNTTAVKQAAFVSDGTDRRLIFKLSPEAPADFAINSIYVFVDNDRATGRKGIGNEYYFDIAKKMISSYTADGKGTLHRKAVTASRDGQWYILTIPAKFFAVKELDGFEIVFNIDGKKSDRIVLRGNAAETADFQISK
jgi:hypothetical protein